MKGQTIKRFASLDMFLEFGDWGFRMGRPIANESFLRALLTYGSYDKYEFFCPDVFHKQKFKDSVKTLVNDPQLLSRIETQLQKDLYHSIKEKEYHIFHQGDFTHFMPYIISMRNGYSSKPFPITGITHSLDGVFMNLRYLELIYAGIAPYDGIICSSNAAQNAVKKGMTWLIQHLNHIHNINLPVDPKLKRIPLGIDDCFFRDYEKSSARAYLKIPENLTVVLSVGRLSLRHKMDLSPLLEMLARMYSDGNYDDLIFVFAGGADESEINLLDSLIARLNLKQRVLLFPNFPTEVKTQLYAAADYYISIVDNFQETFGLNIIEAMASGLPVIASDFSGYRELISDDTDGFLIPTTWSQHVPEFINKNLGVLEPSLARLYLSQTVAVDLAKLQQAITTLYSNKELKNQMGKLAKKKAGDYQWQNIIKSYENFWDDLWQEVNQVDFDSSRSAFSLLTGDFEKTFSHYPSRIMSDDTIVSLTEVGKNILDGKMDITKYEDVDVCLSSELEAFLLNQLSKGSQSVRLMKQQAADDLDARNGQTEFHLLWLLKHGAINKIK